LTVTSCQCDKKYVPARFVNFLFDDVSYSRWLAETDGDIQAVERTLNHLHLWDVFDPKSGQEYAAVSALSWKIAGTWKLAARTTFPTREFFVEVSDEPEDYGPTITLCSGLASNRSGLTPPPPPLGFVRLA
jgi:hypothetical protein